MDDPARQQPTLPMGVGPLGDSGVEEEVLARLRRGGQAALASEFMRHRPRLHRMVQMRLDHRAVGQVDPSDVLQEAFFEAVRQLDQYLAHPPMPLFLWLRYLTGQRILAIHRRLGVDQKQDSCQEVPMESVPRPEADSVSLSRRLADQLRRTGPAAGGEELYARLEQAIAQLAPLDREILALRHFEQLNNQEAAEELGLSPAAASRRYVQALQKLREAMAPLPGPQSEP
ncbi:MAG TPA: sigma-70 family RNA polymerase sigma factor [Thermoguttaceae bacterium]|nr:sigma-70 family RNA polymerase sigma factor [Thermoguttaceae bacterium]